MDEIKYYEKLLAAMISNTILNLSDLISICNRNLSNFTEANGYSISAVSRIRNKVKREPSNVMTYLPYTISMLNGIDSIYLFEYMSEEQQTMINSLLFDNMIEDVYLFRNVDDEAVYSRQLSDQVWYQIDYKNNKGFLYQIQYFLHKIDMAKKTSSNAENEIVFYDLIKSSKVAFTVPGFNEHYKELENIYDSLKKRYFDNDDVTIFVSPLIKRNSFYNVNEFEYPQYIKICWLKEATAEQIENSPQYVQDIIYILEYLFPNNINAIKSNSLLLFISDEDELNHLKHLFKLLELEIDIMFVYKRYSVNKRQSMLMLEFKNQLLEFKFVDPISLFKEIMNNG